MDSYFFSIFVGIITYIIIEILSKIFNKIILPWYQSIIYEGIDISGEWVGYPARKIEREYVKGEFPYSVISIVQNGHKINGEIIITKQPSGKEDHKIFTIKGLFYNNNLIVIQKVKEKSKMGGGSCVMKLTEDGKTLKGTSTYVSSYDSGIICSAEKIWVRNSPQINNK